MPFPQRVRLLFSSLSSSKFGDKISCFADTGCLTLDPGSRIRVVSILDPGSWIQIFPSWIPDPRSEFFPSRILDPGCTSKNLSILTKKMVSQLSKKFDQGFPSRIRIPDLNPDFLHIPGPDTGSQIANPGIKKTPGPWSWILDPDSQHWRFLVCSGCRG